MENNLYISDLDFTLLNSGKLLSEVTRQGIELLNSKEVKFTVATARSVHSVFEIIGDISFKLPIIEFNGGFITEYVDKNVLHIANMNNNDIKEIVEITRNYNMEPIISCWNNGQKVYPPLKPTNGMNLYITDRINSKDARFQKPSKYEDIHSSKVVTLSYMDKKEEIDKIYLRLSSHFENKLEFHRYENKYTPGIYWLTINDKMATKENAIVNLVKLLKLDNYKITVFGDDVNDIGMLKAADHGIAVANAKPCVKDVADEIIGTNDEDAVIKYIFENENIEL